MQMKGFDGIDGVIALESRSFGSWERGEKRKETE
jgi:hypothetical protein